MVIANPAHAERCITSDDENEVCDSSCIFNLVFSVSRLVSSL